MGFFDFLTGGNSKVAAKTTASVFNYGLELYGNEEEAFVYTYINRCETIAKYIKCSRDEGVVHLLCGGYLSNLTQLAIASLATGAAPKWVPYDQTYEDFHESVSKHLIKFGMPEEYVNGFVRIEKQVLEYLKMYDVFAKK